MDDVDEYLERVAVEAEALQEQVRLASDRVKQATERATSLEQQLEQARRTQQAQLAQQAQKGEQAEHSEVADDSLQRTLLLAQKFLDQTRQEAEREASDLVATSEARARNIVADAEEHVRVMTEDAERSLREEVKRLDSHRAELVADVETIARHLEVERTRIREALTEMLAWVDEHVQPPKSAGSHALGATDQPQPKVRDRVVPSEQAGGGAATEGDSAPASKRVAESSVTDDRAASDEDDRRGAGGTTGRRASEETTERETVRASRDDVGISGLPTEQVPVTSRQGSDLDDLEVPDDEFAARPTVPRDQPVPRGSSDRSASGHQRQMFAPGRESRQAGSGVIR